MRTRFVGGRSEDGVGPSSGALRFSPTVVVVVAMSDAALPLPNLPHPLLVVVAVAVMVNTESGTFESAMAVTFRSSLSSSSLRRAEECNWVWFGGSACGLATACVTMGKAGNSSGYGATQP